MKTSTSDKRANPRRLVCVSPYAPFAGIDHAGGEYLYQYVRSMQSAGWFVTVIVPENETNLDATRRRDSGPIEILTYPTSHESRLARRAHFVLTGALTKNPAPSWLGLPEVDRALSDADVIDLQWYESLAHASAIKKQYPNAALIGTAHDVMSQSVARARKSGRILKRLESAMAIRAVRRREISALNSIDLALVFKTSDVRFLQRLACSTRVDTVPPYVEFPADAPSPDTTSHDVLFTAAFWRDENQEAARWLLDRVWPLVTSADSRARIIFAGSRPPKWLLDRQTDAVRVTGYIPSLIAAYEGVLCVVAPLTRGAGLKFKVVQSIALGFPTVGTTVAFEGLEDFLNEDAPHPVDTPQEFANQICAVLADPCAAKAAAIALAGKLRPSLNFDRRMHELSRTIEDIEALHRTRESDHAHTT